MLRSGQLYGAAEAEVAAQALSRSLSEFQLRGRLLRCRFDTSFEAMPVFIAFAVGYDEAAFRVTLAEACHATTPGQYACSRWVATEPCMLYSGYSHNAADASRRSRPASQQGVCGCRSRRAGRL